MICDKILQDAEFGHLYIKTNARAVQYTFHPARDGSDKCGILITVPSSYALSDLLRSVEKMRPKLREMLKKYFDEREKQNNSAPSRPVVDWNFRIDSDCLQVSFVKGNKSGFYIHNEEVVLHKDERGNPVIDKPAQMQVFCPEDCDFQAEGRQEWLEKVIVEGLRNHAKAQFVKRVSDYAKRYNIQLNEVKVNTSKSHWGSCGWHQNGGVLSKKKYYNINLSVFTLLLPMDVQRLVLLHELMHTHHMDHSQAFHHDLDVWLGGKEAELEQKLKKYNTTIFSFATCSQGQS